MVQQYNLSTCSPFARVASLYLRSEQRRRRYASPMWVDVADMHRLQLSLSKRRSHETVWVPSTFLVPPTQREEPGCDDEASTWPQGTEEVQQDAFHVKDTTAPVALMNAAFLEETDLFLFLVANPLSQSHLALLNRPRNGGAFSITMDANPTSNNFSQRYLDPVRDIPLISGSQLVCWRGGVEVCKPGSLGYVWLAQSHPCVSAQLFWGAESATSVQRGEHTSHGPRPSWTDTEDRAANGNAPDYLTYLIQPPRNAGTDRPTMSAENLWVDATAVNQFSLSCFSDAFWTPFHWMHPPQRTCRERNTRRGHPSVLGHYLLNTDELHMSTPLAELMEDVLRPQPP